jgi:hypothetical protein
MSEPKRIQRKRTKGWNMPPGTVYVGRPSKWGNPFTAYPNADHEERAYIVAEYSAWLRFDPGAEHLRQWLYELRGKDLACWCGLEQPCHADVLLEFANAANGAETEGE